MTIKHFLGEKTLTVIVGNRPRSIDRDHPYYDEIVAAINDPEVTEQWILELLDPLLVLQNSPITGDSIQVHQTTVTRDGEELPIYLQQRIVDTLRQGLPVEPWKLFVERVYANPSYTARDELARFMERGKLPMTTDGKFLAYKRVTVDYLDCWTQTIDNSVGTTVVMKGGRKAVDSNRLRTCSNGLHVCSQGYLASYYGGNGRIVIVEVDPADVVSIPADHNDEKARVWRYTVVGEVPLSTEKEALEWGVISLDHLNEDGLVLADANIDRLLAAFDEAVASGNSYEVDELRTAIDNAVELRDRILDRLEELEEEGDDLYEEEDDEEDLEVDLANYEDAPVEYDFDSLLDEAEEAEREHQQAKAAPPQVEFGAAYYGSHRPRRSLFRRFIDNF